MRACGLLMDFGLGELMTFDLHVSLSYAVHMRLQSLLM